MTGQTAIDMTRAIQREIDGGGHVRLDPGTYLVRTLQLRSGLTLEIPTGTKLLAHPENNAFDLQEKLPYDPHADMETSDFAHGMLVGRNVDGVEIVGGGTIDMARTVRSGPKPIALRQCRDVRIEGITIRRAPNYCVSLGACDGVVVQGVTIRDALSDGIDPDSCRRVRIAECDVESDDDAICVKASLFLGVAARLRGHRGGALPNPLGNERLQDRHGDERFGAARTRAGLRVRRSTARRSRRPHGRPMHEAGGVSIQTVDGADVEGVTVERVRIRDTRGALSVRRGARGRGQPAPRPGLLRDVVLRDVEVTNAREPSSIVGLPDFPVQRVTLERVRADMLGGGSHDGSAVPELPDAYPQNTMFGALPAWGLYVRHVEGLTMHAVDLQTRSADGREMIVLDDVS